MAWKKRLRVEGFGKIATDQRSEDGHDDNCTKLGQRGRPVHTTQPDKLRGEATDADHGPDSDRDIFLFLCSSRRRNERLCALGEDGKGLKSLVVDGSRSLQPDNSSCLAGRRTVPALHRAGLDDVGTGENAGHQEQRTNRSARKGVASNGVFILA